LHDSALNCLRGCIECNDGKHETRSGRLRHASGSFRQRPRSFADRSTSVQIKSQLAESGNPRTDKALQRSSLPRAAARAALGELDAVLGAVIEAWPSLPEPIRRAIAALVNCNHSE
jgi:hypothetical protein